MRTLLLFLVPPAAGAVIGFVTNAIAIKMLFRPLKEIRLLGFRLPFTPGILPRQRERLAQSIGAMVERELLTPEILRTRLLRGDTQEKIREALSLFTENILHKNPGEILGSHSDFFAAKAKEAAQKAYPSVIAEINAFLRRNEIRRELESRGLVLLNKIFLQLNAFQRLFISAGQYDLTLQEKMPEIIGDLIAGAEKFLESENVKSKIINTAVDYINQIISGRDKKIGEILNIDEDGKKKLDDYIFTKLTAALDERIESILASINIKTLVSERIDSLDMIRVERIILDVMADQFKWINIFGAIIGFLIGIFQVLFSQLIR